VSELGKELGKILRESLSTNKSTKVNEIRKKIEEYEDKLIEGEKQVSRKIGRVLGTLQLAGHLMGERNYSAAARIIKDMKRSRILDEIISELYSLNKLKFEQIDLKLELRRETLGY